MASTPIEQVRALIQDDGPPTGFLTDEQIQAFIDIEGGDIYAAASMGAQALSSIFAQKVDIKAGPVEIKNSQKAKAYANLYKSLKHAASTGGGGSVGFLSPRLTGTSLSAMDAADNEPDRYSSTFYRGVTDNPGTETDVERSRS